MRRELVQTYRNTSVLESEVVETIPRSDRVLSPKSDRSLERRSKSIKASEFNQFKTSQASGSQTNLNISASVNHLNHFSAEQFSQQLKRSSTLFINEIQKLKSDNRQLSYDNELLFKENQMIKNSMEHQIRQSKQSRTSNCSIEELKSGYLQSYYTRIKAIQERVQYYEAQSKANQHYSNCFIQINKCLSSEQLSIDQLKSKIMTLMEECQSYKQQIKRLDEICRSKQHNTNEQLQKIIMDFNETVFIKNQLQIRIFDLTTQNNSLRTTIYELKCRVEEQQVYINKMGRQFNDLHTNLTTSKYQMEQSIFIEQNRLNLEHLQRENEHLKMEIATYKTKAEHYTGSQFNQKQQITRLNNFISELNTKWHVEFQHNGVLQQQRKNHLRQITRLGDEIQRINICLDETRHNHSKFKLDVDSANESKRIVERQKEIFEDELRQYKQRNNELSHLNQKLEQQLRSSNIKIGRLNDVITESTRAAQNKENNYLQQLNSLRQQIHHIKNQWQMSNQHLITKEEEMRLVCSQMNQSSEHTLEQIRNQSRLEIERQRSHVKILNDKIKDLEGRLEINHKHGLELEGQLSSKRMIIAELQSSYHMKHSEYEENIRRMENMFNFEREQLNHTKVLLENEVQISQSRMKEMEQTIYRIKQSQMQENQNISFSNTTLQRTVQQYEVLIQTLKNRVIMLQNVEKQKNKYQSDCINLEKQINQRAFQMETFIKKTSDQHSIRKQSYENQILSLQAIIKKNEDQFKGFRKEYQQRISELNYKNNQLQNNMSKQTILLEQQSRSQSHFKTILEQLKRQYNTQLQGLKSDLLSNIHQQRQKKSNNEFESLIERYEERLGNVVNSLQKILRDDNRQDKRQLEEWFNQEVRNIKDRCVDEANRTRRQMNEFVNNEKTLERNYSLKIMELEKKIKSYEGVFQQISLERTVRVNKETEVNQRNFFQFQMLSKENDTLKQSNLKFNSLLVNSEQTILALRSELSNWSIRYDKQKMESQFHEEKLTQQIQSLKSTIADLEKHTLEIGTKATFTDNDRTLDRLISMPDLNKSSNTHNKSIEGRYYHHNPEISVIQEAGARIKNVSNRIVERVIHPSQVVVNIIQKGKDEEQKMIQPSTFRNSIQNRAISPRNQKGFGFIPIVMNEQPISPTHTLRFAPRRNSVSPPFKRQETFVDRRQQVKIKQASYFPQTLTVLSPRMHSPPKVSTSPPPTNLNYRVSTIKPQTKSIITFPNSSFLSKPTSPNQKQTKLSVTLLHSNAVGKAKQISIEKFKNDLNSHRSSDGRYCC